MPAPTRQLGITLIELMTVLAVILILATIAVPMFDSTLQRRRLAGAADQLYADLHYARSEAIKQNKTVIFDFKDSSDPTKPWAWCYGMDDELSTSSTCNCRTTPGNCTIETLQKTTLNHQDPPVFPGIVMTASATALTFNPRRGTVGPTTPKTFTLTAPNGDAKTVEIKTTGRVTVCEGTQPCD